MPRPTYQSQKREVAANVCFSYPEGAVPTAGTEGHAIRTDSQAADAILVTGQNSNTFTLERIPNIAGPVVVSSEENTSGDGEGDGGDTAQNVVVREGIELAISTNVKQPARSIVRASSECIAIGEKAGTCYEQRQVQRIRYTHLTALMSDSCPVKV